MPSQTNAIYDVIVVQKRTAYERYFDETQHTHYWMTNAGDARALWHAHTLHERHCELVFGWLKSRGLSYQVLRLDELATLPVYQPGGPSVLNSKLGLVIALGGDGTVLHASHYVGGDTTLFGINVCDEYSVGHLCAVAAPLGEDVLDALLHRQKTLPGKHQILDVSRLWVRAEKTTCDSKSIPLALNDILICHQHPGAASRYQVSAYHNSTENTQWTDTQISSGLWVATAAGTSAAIRSYPLPIEKPLPLTDKRLFVAVRELYQRPQEEDFLAEVEGANNNAISVWSDEYDLLIQSRMRTGVCCVDGPDGTYQFGFGCVLRVSHAAGGSLRLVV